MGQPTGRLFAEMFGRTPLSNDGWVSSDEFLATLHTGRSDPRLHAAYLPTGMQAQATGNVASDGGFSVPTEYAAQWLDSSLETEIVRPRAAVWPMQSASRRVPGWDASDSTSNLFGAFTGQWVGEAGEITAETPKLRSIELKARKLAILTQASNELLADGLGYGDQLGRPLSERLVGSWTARS
ncbi:MAG: phage major capsid protein [Acidobacteria bacterium]|nr:phage major capsid protein [Acidobacteriota bacterium]